MDNKISVFSVVAIVFSVMALSLCAITLNAVQQDMSLWNKQAVIDQNLNAFMASVLTDQNATGQWQQYTGEEISSIGWRLDALDGGVSTIYACSFNFGDHVATGTVVITGKETLAGMGYGVDKCVKQKAYVPFTVGLPQEGQID